MMNSTTTKNTALPSPWIFYLLGTLTILLGIIAINAPLITGLAVQFLIGGALLVGGIFEIIHALKSHEGNRTFFAVLSGLLAILCAGVLFCRPLLGLGVLTLLLVAYFILDGLSKLALYLQMRPAKGSAWVLLSALITLLLGLFIGIQWPLSGIWAIGTLIGINLIFDGWAMFFLGAEIKALR